MNYKKLEYLDLEIYDFRKIKLNLQNKFRIQCNIEHLEEQYKHIPHTSNSQLNFIVDLLINLGQNLEIGIKEVNNNIEAISNIFEGSRLSTLRKNLDYIKEVISDFSNQIKRFPNKKEILDLIHLIDLKTPKPVEIQTRNLIEELHLEVEKIKDTQEDLQEQIEAIKKLVSE